MLVRNIRLRTPGPHNCTLFVPFCLRIGWAEFGAYSVIENKGIEKLNFERYFICLAPASQPAMAQSMEQSKSATPAPLPPSHHIWCGCWSWPTGRNELTSSIGYIPFRFRHHRSSHCPNPELVML